MIGTETISRVIGADVYDDSGEKIGSASMVYLDDETGRPEWITVRTGLFGTQESFVPIREAALTDEGVRLAVSKSAVKDAPKVDNDKHLSPQEEQELYRYYGMDVGHDAGMATSPTATDDAMTRSEERVRVGARDEEIGRVRLRKYVVTENVTETVPVSHEEVRVVREPITDANVEEALAGPTISEAEHEVTLHAERPVVEKEAVPVERVRLDKETVSDQEQVTTEIRKEEIEVDEEISVDAPRDADRRI